MDRLAKSNDEILSELKSQGIKKVKVAITDMDGVLRGKYIHIDKFLSAAKSGFGFCNVVLGWDSSDVCYDNCEFTGWHTGYPDANVEIDLQTYRQVPWDRNVPFFLGHFVKEDKTPLAICPRQLLRGVIGSAADMGYKAKVGLEFEWFNFRETPQSLQEKGFQNLESLTPGMFGYSLVRAGQNGAFFNAIMDEMYEYRVQIEGLHTETGPGVYEAAIGVTDPLEAADCGVLFKSGVKEIAQRFDVMPTFMAKWNSSLPGCSGHIHQSLWSLDEKIGQFHSDTGTYSMSSLFENYLAGQLHCLREILPMFAPNVNSYKRLVEGLWAPTASTWSVDNRTASLRVIPGSSNSTRLETRVPGSDVNPYLAVSAALASGLYGIKNKLKLPYGPAMGNAYKDEKAPKFANNLLDATKIMAKSEVAKELFGTEFVNHYTASKEWEWRQSQAVVTDWELKRYFEVI